MVFFKVKSVKTINTPEEKLNWIFTAFDSDGGGSIDVEEISEIVLGCFRSVGFSINHDLSVNWSILDSYFI